MKRIISLLTILLVMSACSTSQTEEVSQSFDVIDTSLDVLVMTEFMDQLYIGTNEGLYVKDQADGISPVDLIKPLSLIHTLYVAKDGQLYIGGMNGLIVMTPDGQQAYYDDTASWLPDTRVLYVTGDDDGTIYIGTFGGLGILDIKTMTGETLTEEDGLLVQMVNRIVLTEDGSIWLASYNVRNGGITRLKEGVMTYYQDELASIHITATLLDGNLLYFGGGVYDKGGLTLFELEGDDWVIKELYYEEDGFAGAKVRSLYSDGHLLMIGSEYSGLALWEEDQKSIYTTKDGLPHNEVKCIYKYQEDVYLGTRAGLAKWQ